jgi:RimJ/RimL family protein N-acetyltransferase
MENVVTPLVEEHIAGYRAAFDQVAHEHRFLDYLEAPSAAAVQKFVSDNIRNQNPQFVVLDGTTVVGWCIIVPKVKPIYQHTGVLGMGIVEGYRGRGIGTALITSALVAARQRGLKRVELQVRENSISAVTLFERSGFVMEGIMRKHAFVDGKYENSVMMAMLF